MNDFDKATKNIGNRFDLVLVASERMRELHRKRKEQEDLGILQTDQRITRTKPCDQAVYDVENKVVGREYLKRLQSKNRKKNLKFDDII